MKIVFLIPPETHNIESSVPKRLEDGKGIYPKLGILYVAGYYQKKCPGDSIEMIDCPASGIDYAQLQDVLATLSPDVVALTTLTFTLIDAVATIRLVKKVCPQCKTVLGGHHVNLYPQESLSLEGVDYVVHGEGEHSFYMLMQGLKQGASLGELAAIKGVGGKQNGQTELNREKDKINDLNALPFPARTFIHLDQYGHMIGRGHRIATIQSSRGCPAACTFCDIRKTKFRQRSPQNVVDEMEFLAGKFGVDDFFFVDDTFTINKKRVFEICDLIKKRRLPIHFKISARVDTVRPDLLDALASAGCYRIHYGVETATPRLIQYLEKGITLDKVERAFAWTKAAGIGTFAYMMIGIPTETRDEIEDSIRFVKKIDPDYAQFSICTPYPKTELYWRMMRDNHVPEDYWQRFAERPSRSFRVRFFNDNFSENQLREIQDYAHASFYRRWRVFLREFLRLRSFSDLLQKIKIGTRVITGHLNS